MGLIAAEVLLFLGGLLLGFLPPYAVRARAVAKLSSENPAQTKRNCSRGITVLMLLAFLVSFLAFLVGGVFQALLLFMLIVLGFITSGLCICLRQTITTTRREKTTTGR